MRQAKIAKLKAALEAGEVVTAAIAWERWKLAANSFNVAIHRLKRDPHKMNILTQQVTEKTDAWYCRHWLEIEGLEAAK